MTCLSEFKTDGRGVPAEFLFDFVFDFWATDKAKVLGFEMTLAQKAARALMVMALLQALQQLTCSRAIDLTLLWPMAQSFRIC